MPEQDFHDEPPRYDETTRPSNPPNSVVRPAVRRTAVRAYIGILVVTFLIVGAALLFWAPRDGNRLPDGQGTPSPTSVGTSGERMPREGTPGGFEPAPDHDSTRSELEYRGAGERPQGPMPGLQTTNQVELTGVEVERADGDTFWVRSDGRSVTVVAPGGMPTVRAGQTVDVTGTSEDGGTRIRASRIEVR